MFCKVLVDNVVYSVVTLRVVMKKIQKELTELLAKAVGKVAKDLTVKDAIQYQHSYIYVF